MAELSDEEKQRIYGCLGLIVVFFIGVIFLSTGNKSGRTGKPSSTTSAPKQEIVSNSSWDGSVRQVKDWLKSNLKDPKSLETIEWSPVSKLPDGKYQVRCKYRAKNSFGGYNVSNSIFTLDSKGNVIGNIELH